MGTQENKASARRFLEEIINRGNVAAIDELSSPNIVDHTAPPGVPAGNEGFKMFITTFRAAFPDLHYTVDDEIVLMNPRGATDAGPDRLNAKGIIISGRTGKVIGAQG